MRERLRSGRGQPSLLPLMLASIWPPQKELQNVGYSEDEIWLDDFAIDRANRAIGDPELFRKFF